MGRDRSSPRARLGFGPPDKAAPHTCASARTAQTATTLHCQPARSPGSGVNLAPRSRCCIEPHGGRGHRAPLRTLLFPGRSAGAGGRQGGPCPTAAASTPRDACTRLGPPELRADKWCCLKRRVCGPLLQRPRHGHAGEAGSAPGAPRPAACALGAAGGMAHPTCSSLGTPSGATLRGRQGSSPSGPRPLPQAEPPR